MYLIGVTPIARGIAKDVLTYFSAEKPPLGSIASVPVRSKRIKALVTEVSDASDQKSHIKSLAYELKKADRFDTHKITLHAFIETAKEVATWYATSLGSVLWGILPHLILLKSGSLGAVVEKGICPLHPGKKIVIRGGNEERWNTYRSHIRACFARKCSAYITVPTIEDAINASDFIARGIEKYTFVLHSELSHKKTIETWKAILASDHPVLIIGTTPFLSVPRPDLGLIIIEREHSRAYRMQSRPYVDLRRFIEKYAEMIGTDLISGDNVVGIETWWRATRGEENIEYREEPSNRECAVKIIDMGTYKVEAGKPFVVLSDEVRQMIEQTRKNEKRAFLFTPRKGLYPTTVCADCGKTVVCERCSAPVVVHQSKTEDVFTFICHHCGKERPTEERCLHCGSWRLAAIGVGIERVAAEIRKDYPDINLFVLDKQSNQNRSEIKKTLQAFYKTPGSILLGTEYALLYLREVENSAVISLDSLFLIPDFRMHERILSILGNIESRTLNTMIVQTRDPSHAIFETLHRKTLREFYINEANLRKTLGYPPFSLYVKISRAGKQENVEHDLQTLKEKLSEFTTIFTPGRIERIKNMYIAHLLIRLRPDEWPNKKLTEVLTSLPPSFAVRVDPDTLL